MVDVFEVVMVFFLESWVGEVNYRIVENVENLRESMDS